MSGLISVGRWRPDKATSIQSFVEDELAEYPYSEPSFSDANSRMGKITATIGNLMQHLFDRNLLTLEEIPGILSTSDRIEESDDY